MSAIARASVLLLAVCALSAAAGVFAFPPIESCDDSVKLDIASDGYQYPSIGKNLLGFLYREWWFFAAYDNVHDIAIAFGLAVHDPSGQFHKQASGLSGMVWPSVSGSPGKTLNFGDEYAFSDFSASVNNATVRVGPNTIDVIDANTYKLVGRSKDGLFAWDLLYKRHDMVYPCRQKEDFKALDIYVDWISYMPSAAVSGTVQIQGKTIPFSTDFAYHDHNFGQWLGSAFNWIWAQFSSNSGSGEFGIVFGGFRLPGIGYVGYVFMRYQGERVKIGSFCGDHFSFTPLEFQTDSDTGKPVSVHNQIEAYNKKWRLTIDYRARASALNPGGEGLNLFVFEQVSKYNVQLFKYSGSAWASVGTFEGFGFSEWSDKTK